MQALQWGLPDCLDKAASLVQQQPFDLIVASDCIYLDQVEPVHVMQDGMHACRHVLLLLLRGKGRQPSGMVQVCMSCDLVMMQS